MQSKKNNQQHIIIRARRTGQFIVYLATFTFHPKYLKLFIQIVRETSVRKTSVRENDRPGNVLYGK